MELNASLVWNANAADGKKFDWPEYAVFASSLLVSAFIGVYYGCFGNRQKSNKEFLVANRQMPAFPVALSLLCSFLSANSMIGNPVEIYYFGCHYVLTMLTYVPLTLVLGWLYAPVFFELNLTSAYEYFELRFNRPIRLLMSVISNVYVMFYMGLVVYGPSLALSQVTGINMRILTGAIFLVCIFYSSLGGMKAVLWTDTLQALIVVASLVLVVFKGAADIGGFGVVWERAAAGNRTDFFNWDLDPRTKHTVWTGTVGSFFVWLTTYAATQANIQRFACVPDMKTVWRALWINMIGLYITIGLILVSGLVVFARYYLCDPVSNKDVTSPDQLIPLLVMDVLGSYSGLPGLFVAGLTSASLSSVSSGLNGIAAVVSEDYVKYYKPNMSDEMLSKISKLVSVVSGFIAYLFVIMAEVLAVGGVFSAGVSIFGLVMGPTLGLFTLGMFFPWANSVGALLGVIGGFAFTGFISIGQQIAKYEKVLPDQRLPVSTLGCELSNATVTHWANDAVDVLRPADHWKLKDDSLLVKVWSTSFMWHPCYGCIATVLLGLVFSFLFSSCRKKRKVSERYFSPPLLRMWKAVVGSASIRKYVEFVKSEY